MKCKEEYYHKFVDALFFRDVEKDRCFKRGMNCCKCLEEVRLSKWIMRRIF